MGPRALNSEAPQGYAPWQTDHYSGWQVRDTGPNGDRRGH